MAKTDKTTTIKQIAEKLFQLLEFDLPVDVIQKEETVEITTEMEEPGILIGYHGETLSSLQLIISLIYYKTTGIWQEILLNVGNYREVRKEQLKQIVERIIEQVKQTNTPHSLPFLSPGERKVVHLLVEENPDIYSESEGEGQYRRLYIKPKPNKISSLKTQI